MREIPIRMKAYSSSDDPVLLDRVQRHQSDMCEVCTHMLYGIDAGVKFRVTSISIWVIIKGESIITKTTVHFSDSTLGRGAVTFKNLSSGRMHGELIQSAAKTMGRWLQRKITERLANKRAALAGTEV